MNPTPDLTPFQPILAGMELLPLPAEAEAIRTIRFIAHPSADLALPAGASKLGGLPDLPPRKKWPVWKGRPLEFLGQINLADLSGFPTARPLPPKGLLLFFFDPDQTAWGYSPDHEGGWRVIYAPDTSHLQRAEPGISRGGITCYPTCSLEFHDTLKLKNVWGDETQVAVGFAGESWVELEGTYDPLDGFLAHRILGEPDSIQLNDMRKLCQLVSNGVYMGGSGGFPNPDNIAAFLDGAEEWVLLLQLDSDEAARMQWGDSGRLYFWIRREDLRARRFDLAWMVLQCN